jgi:hypothetical protein
MEYFAHDKCTKELKNLLIWILIYYPSFNFSEFQGPTEGGTCSKSALSNIAIYMPGHTFWLVNLCSTIKRMTSGIKKTVSSSQVSPFRHSWLISGFVARLTRRVPLVKQELLTLPEYLSSPRIFSGVYVTRSLALCVCY